MALIALASEKLSQLPRSIEKMDAMYFFLFLIKWDEQSKKNGNKGYTNINRSTN